MLSYRLALPKLCWENNSEAILCERIIALSSREAALYADAAVVLRKKKKATYRLIVIPDGIRQICLHCRIPCPFTLKLNLKNYSHDSASEGTKYMS